VRPRVVVAFAVPLALWLAPEAHAITNPQIPGLQVALRAKGFYQGEIDGIAGPQTARAVRRFQRRSGLAVDGVAGPATRKELGRLGRPLWGQRVLIARGAVGWDVSVLEFFLRRRGFRPGSVDGRFDGRTERALRRYQRQRHLLVDGIAGPQTLRTFGVHTRASQRRAVGGKRAVRAAITHWSRSYGVDPRLVRALAWMESGFQVRISSSAGAWGPMQVMPATWRYAETVLIGHRVPRTADGGVRVGTAYLHQLLHQFRSRERLAVGAYYQGARAVRRRGLYAGTRRFVADVFALKARRF
jgi:hypothetical protein